MIKERALTGNISGERSHMANKKSNRKGMKPVANAYSKVPVLFT